MVLVIDAICDLLNCSPLSLSVHLDDPHTRIHILKEFLDRKVRTTYLNRSSEKKVFIFGGITRKSANKIRAYGPLRRTFNVTISQHFYTRHRIKLRYPNLKCIIDRRPWEKDRFYPLELLEFVDEVEEETSWLSSKFYDKVKISPPDSPEIIMNEQFDDEMEIYRGDFSQDGW